jgi:hypothetical protein
MYSTYYSTIIYDITREKTLPKSNLTHCKGIHEYVLVLGREAPKVAHGIPDDSWYVDDASVIQCVYV